MSADKPGWGCIRFDGSPTIFYMAICSRCQMTMPFGSGVERERWISAHSTTLNHSIDDVTLAIEVRPESKKTMTLPMPLGVPLFQALGFVQVKPVFHGPVADWQILGLMTDEGMQQ